MRAFILLLLLISNYSWAESVRPPMWVSWADHLKSKSFSASQKKKLRFIVQDAIWQEEASTYEGQPGERPLIGNQTGADALNDLIAEAEKGESASLALITELFEMSGSQRTLVGLDRSTIWSGTAILRPDESRGNVATPLRQAIARSLLKSGGSHTALFEKLLPYAVKDPNNTAFVEAFTALAAMPTNSASPFLRDYFLLMSVHPEPKVRLAGLIGLSPFAREPQVRATLLEESRIHSEDKYQNKNWRRAERVLELVGPKYPAWRSIFSEIFGRWQKDVFVNRYRDMGDYNWDRMANAAAAQALLSSVELPRRSVIVDGREAEESTATHTTLPRVDGFTSGNGSGFHITRSLNIKGEPYAKQDWLTTRAMTVAALPREAWIFQGMNRPGLARLFNEMVKNWRLEVHYGHYESVVSWMKYKILQLPPPDDYYELLSNFQQQLSAKVRAESAEMEKLGVRVVTTQDVCKILNQSSADTSNVVSLPCRKPVVEKENEREQIRESVFTASLGALYAARALVALDQKETAAEVLVSLLPKRWDLSVEDRATLAKNLQTHAHDGFVSADITAASKREALAYVFAGLKEALGESPARSAWMRWMAGLSDVQLAESAREVLNISCDHLLRR